MNEGRLSRRALLATVGATATGAGLFTVRSGATLADRETLSGLLAAGSVDLKVGYEAYERRLQAASSPQSSSTDTHDGGKGRSKSDAKNGQGGKTNPKPRETVETLVAADPAGQDGMVRPPYDDPCETLPDPGQLPSPLFDIEDVTPGDGGRALFDVHVCGNDSYVWLTGDLTENAENGVVPGEVGDETPAVGELADALQARLWYDDCDGEFADEPIIFEGSLAAALDYLEGGYALSPTGTGACLESDKLEDGGTPDLLSLEDTVYEFPFDGNTVPVLLTNYRYKEDGSELIAFDFEVQDPDYGVCTVGVKAGKPGGGPGTGSEPTSWATFSDCAESGTVWSTEREKGGYYGISHVTFSLCEAGGACFEACTDHCVGFEWWLPEDAPLDAQTDSVAFDLGFVAEQCRHNGGGDR